MDQPAEIENDALLTLLSDALLAGPGSPAWQQALAALSADASGRNLDEYRLLIDAREALQGGKDYRSVRAGQGFTRKLLNNIDEESAGGGSRIPVAAIVGLLAALAVVIVGAVLIYQFIPHNTAPVATTKGISDLASVYFPTEVLSSKFDTAIPPAWRKIGSLPIEAKDGLQAGVGGGSEEHPVGGGIVAVDPIPADQPFSLQVNLSTPGHSTDLIPQVFVSNSNDFSTDRAISGGEIVWELRGSKQQSIVDGKVENESAIPTSAASVAVKFIVNRDLAIIEADGQRLWAGPNPLGSSPRYIGIRFIEASAKVTANLVVKSVTVKKS